jgi:hypothetical protein
VAAADFDQLLLAAEFILCGIPLSLVAVSITVINCCGLNPVIKHAAFGEWAHEGKHFCIMSV